MTREEHMKWCKERAIQEFDYYLKSEGMTSAIRNGLTSMASDMRKHPETIPSNALSAFTLLNENRMRSRQEFVNFINGFR